MSIIDKLTINGNEVSNTNISVELDNMEDLQIELTLDVGEVMDAADLHNEDYLSEIPDDEVADWLRGRGYTVEEEA